MQTYVVSNMRDLNRALMNLDRWTVQDQLDLTSEDWRARRDAYLKRAMHSYAATRAADEERDELRAALEAALEVV